MRELEATVKDLQARVQVTEDVNDIKEVQWTYLNALMATEWDTCADCFAENALVDVYLHDPVRGRETIEHWFKEELSETHSGNEGDVCIHPIITVDGDTATGNWLLYMMYFYKRTGQSMFWVQGYYDRTTSARTGAGRSPSCAGTRPSACRAAARRPGSGEPGGSDPALAAP